MIIIRWSHHVLEVKNLLGLGDKNHQELEDKNLLGEGEKNSQKKKYQQPIERLKITLTLGLGPTKT